MPVRIIMNRHNVETRVEYAFKKGMGVLANEILKEYSGIKKTLGL